MSTFNGFGTMYYGWRHRPDGTATATNWVVALWLPLFPLGRHHLRVLTDFSKKERFVESEDKGFFAGSAVQRTTYELLRKTAPRLAEVLATYVWTYVIGTVLVAWPALLFWGFDAALDRNPAWRQTNAVLYVGLLLGLLLIVNPIAVGLIALRRARGFRGKLFE